MGCSCEQSILVKEYKNNQNEERQSNHTKIINDLNLNQGNNNIKKNFNEENDNNKIILKINQLKGEKK